MANLFFQKEIMTPKISYFGSSRSVRAERLEQVVAERLIIVDDEHLLIEVQRPLCDAKGPFRPSRGESTRTDVYLYPAGAIGEAARKYNGAEVRTNSRSVEPLRHLLEVNVKIRGGDYHIFHGLQRGGQLGGSLAHRLLSGLRGLCHHTLLVCVHGVGKRF
jgi:hypothetical protein